MERMDHTETPKQSSTEANSTEEGSEIISKNPNLEIAQLYFSYKNSMTKLKTEKYTQLLDFIKTNQMGPFYELVCNETDAQIDQALLADLKKQNKKRIEEIDAEIKDAEENLGESEVRVSWLRKSEYLSQIGDKEPAVEAFRTTYEKTVGIGNRIDLIFNLIRLGLFFLDHKLINENIDKARELMEQGGDWDRKNRLRSYEGLYKMSIRDMSAAASLFLEAVPTFGSYELMTYEQLIFYTVVTTIFAFNRPDLREKVIKCNEIQEQLNGGGENGSLIPVKQYLEAFYGCRYDEFFRKLVEIEDTRLIGDRYLHPHHQFYCRAMRLKAYQQFLTPYKTVRLDMMAKDFGVSKRYLDAELYAQVSAGNLGTLRIDAVNGVIEMVYTDTKNQLYKTLLHDGDGLMNRIQKLSQRVNLKRSG
jgi:26S proteasome regulatory subunit N7